MNVISVSDKLVKLQERMLNNYVEMQSLNLRDKTKTTSQKHKE